MSARIRTTCVLLVFCCTALMPQAVARPSGPELCEASYYEGTYGAYSSKHKLWGDYAAHKSYPFHAHLRVTNLDNGKSVDVEILDRGPYVKGRCIDLRRSAFSKIQPTSRGVARVRVECIAQCDGMGT